MCCWRHALNKSASFTPLKRACSGKSSLRAFILFPFSLPPSVRRNEAIQLRYTFCSFSILRESIYRTQAKNSSQRAEEISSPILNESDIRFCCLFAFVHVCVRMYVLGRRRAQSQTWGNEANLFTILILSGRPFGPFLPLSYIYMYINQVQCGLLGEIPSFIHLFPPLGNE